jgi:hypothetical protein
MLRMSVEESPKYEGGGKDGSGVASASASASASTSRQVLLWQARQGRRNAATGCLGWAGSRIGWIGGIG